MAIPENRGAGARGIYTNKEKQVHSREEQSRRGGRTEVNRN